MDDAPYSKREQDAYRTEVLDTLGRIEDQVKKTNGRVSSLEKWQSYVIGFCGCLTLLFIPVLIYLVTHWPK